MGRCGVGCYNPFGDGSLPAGLAEQEKQRLYLVQETFAGAQDKLRTAGVTVVAALHCRFPFYRYGDGVAYQPCHGLCYCSCGYCGVSHTQLQRHTAFLPADRVAFYAQPQRASGGEEKAGSRAYSRKGGQKLLSRTDGDKQRLRVCGQKP